MRGLRLALPFSFALAVSAVIHPGFSIELTTVDASKAPWSAIGRINNSAYGRCSAILVRPRTALTAAHCLYNARSGRFLRPASIHVLFGFNRGAYGFHARVDSIRIPPDYDPAQGAAAAPHDWAVLGLSEAVPAPFAPLALAGDERDAAVPVQAAGFAQERSEVLTASTPCRALGETRQGLLVTDCQLSHGFSGGPLIESETGRLAGMGIAITKAGDAAVGIAIPASRLRRALTEP